MAHFRKPPFFFFLVLPILLLVGCGEQSVFKGIADDKSPLGREGIAREALDKSECQTAIDIYTELQKEDPLNVDYRIDLSASYLCAAGLSTKGLLKVVADFDKSGTSTSAEAKEQDIFRNLTEQVSTLIPDKAVWQANVCKSKELLGEIDNNKNANNKDELEDRLGDATWPCTSSTTNKTGTTTAIFFNDDKDAGYILTIINLADATLTVADALNTISGAAQCAQDAAALAQAGQTTSTCQLTATDLLAVANSLLSAQQSATAATGADGTLLEPIENIVISADADNSGTLGQAEVLNYLLDQQLIRDTSAVATPGCTLTQNPPKYTCAE